MSIKVLMLQSVIIDLDQGSEMIISESILTPFITSIILRGSSEKWLELKTTIINFSLPKSVKML
jgi:hypothetical protein